MTARRTFCGSTFFPPCRAWVRTNRLVLRLFSIQFSDGLTRNKLAVPGFEKPKPTFVFNNPAMVNIASGDTHDPILHYFFEATDAGPSTTDLHALLFSLGPVVLSSIGKTVDQTTFAPVPDPRLQIGVGAPFQLGSVYLGWDGISIGTLKVVEHQFDVFDVRLQRYLDPHDLPNDSLQVPDILFTVPEPTSCVLASLGGIGLLYMGRRRPCRQPMRINEVGS